MYGHGLSRIYDTTCLLSSLELGLQFRGERLKKGGRLMVKYWYDIEMHASRTIFILFNFKISIKETLICH